MVVLFTLYLKEDVNEDGSLKPDAARAYTARVPSEQAVVVSEEDGHGPDFDGEAALKEARTHLSDVDLSQKGRPGTAGDDVD